MAPIPQVRMQHRDRRRCHITESPGSSRASFNTDSGCTIILGGSKLCRKAYGLRQREAIYKEFTATRAMSRCRLPAPSPRITCVTDSCSELSTAPATRRSMKHERGRLVRLEKPSA